MDESESVNRREAVAGLGLLAVMLFGLVGTFVYRLTENPARSPASSAASLAAGPSTLDPAVSLEAAPLETANGGDSTAIAPASTAFPVETPEASAVPPTSVESEAPPFQPVQPAAPATSGNMPHFVAPASRATQ
jgi:hypothetical protein